MLLGNQILRRMAAFFTFIKSLLLTRELQRPWQISHILSLSPSSSFPSIVAPIDYSFRFPTHQPTFYLPPPILKFSLLCNLNFPDPFCCSHLPTNLPIIPPPIFDCIDIYLFNAHHIFLLNRGQEQLTSFSSPFSFTVSS